jgi:hypothetical protein
VLSLLIPVVMLCNVWVYGCLLAQIAGSNATGGMDVCLL